MVQLVGRPLLSTLALRRAKRGRKVKLPEILCGLIESVVAEKKRWLNMERNGKSSFTKDVFGGAYAQVSITSLRSPTNINRTGFPDR